MAHENSVKPSGLLFGFLPPRKVLPEEEPVRHNRDRTTSGDLPSRIGGGPRTRVRWLMFTYKTFLLSQTSSLARALLPFGRRARGDSGHVTGEVAEPTVEAQLAVWPATDFVGRLRYVPCPRRGTHLRLVDCWMCWCDNKASLDQDPEAYPEQPVADASNFEPAA